MLFNSLVFLNTSSPFIPSLKPDWANTSSSRPMVCFFCFVLTSPTNAPMEKAPIDTVLDNEMQAGDYSWVWERLYLPDASVTLCFLSPL